MTTTVSPQLERRMRHRLRGLSYIPLALLVIASLVSLVLGTRVEAAQSQHVVPTQAPPSQDPSAELCRPATTLADQEPWLAGDGSAEATWQQHAAEVGERYIVGPNGWTFWSDYVELYASQAVGRSTLSVGQVDQWLSYWSSLRDGLAAEGIEFYIIVTPSTSSVYPEELPEWMQDLRGSTILDQVLADPASYELPIIDLRQHLIESKSSDVHLFSWSNSHWTDYGGYVGWEQIAPCVNALYPDGAELRVPAVSGHEVVGDFNEWAEFGVPSPGADWSVPVFDEELDDVTLTDKDGVTRTITGSTPLDASWLPATTSVDDSWTGKSALILRDSMGGAISPYWDQAYSPTTQIYHQYAGYESFPKYRELVAQYHPDVVILQFAERHLVNPPPAGAGY